MSAEVFRGLAQVLSEPTLSLNLLFYASGLKTLDTPNGPDFSCSLTALSEIGHTS